MMDRIRDRLESYGKRLELPINAASAERLMCDCKTMFDLHMPSRYIQFLQIANGIEWNGVVFYGADALDVDENSAVQKIFTETSRWWRLRHQLILGNIEDQLFFYSHCHNEYQVWNISGNEPNRHFKEFDELFNYAFDDGRFYKPKLPPPPTWSSYD